MLAGTATAAGMRVLNVFTVNGDRYRSLGCTDTTCWPPDGRAVPVTDITAESVAAGSAPFIDRGDLKRRYAAGKNATEIGRLCDDLAAGAPVGAVDGLTCWAQLLRDPDHGDPRTIATAAVALHVTDPLHVCDAILLWLCPGLGDRHGRAGHAPGRRRARAPRRRLALGRAPRHPRRPGCSGVRGGGARARLRFAARPARRPGSRSRRVLRVVAR